MDLYEIKQHLEKIGNEFSLLIPEEELKVLKKNKIDLENSMLDEGFYQDHNLVKEVSTKLKITKNIIETQELISESLAELSEYVKIIDVNDQDLLKEIGKEVEKLVKQYHLFENSILLDEKYDHYDAIVEIHCGAGGTESQDWVEMLYKMYLGYSRKKDFKIELISASYANDVGIKRIIFKVQGLFGYGFLKNEKGVHRLVRISPFDSNSKRHTTFALVSVSPVMDEINEILINENDIEIDTYRSSGAGGQSVNTTDSAVRIVHKPTKIVVTCQNQRSQIKNKQEALNTLKSKLLELEIEKQRQQIRNLKDTNIDVNFGSQIRSYVFHPYTMVKDHRSNYETSSCDDVLSGELDEVINSVLIMNKGR